MTDLDEKTLSKALGFKMDPASLKDFLSSIKNDKLKNKILTQIQNTPKFDASEFEKNISKYYKPNNSRVKIESNKEKNSKTIIVEAVNLNDFSATEKAFYIAYNPEIKILSDLEENKLKLISPQFVSNKQNFDSNLNEVHDVNIPGIEIERPIIPIPEPEPTQQKSYCICKKPYKEGELMIKCDYELCEGWFHLDCVGFKDKTQEEINKISWYCSDECEKSAKFSKNGKKKIKK